MSASSKPFALDEPAEYKNLRKRIAEIESQWLQTLQKTEFLKFELHKIKNSFNLKFGQLYLELDLLELEIQKKLQTDQLIHQGFNAKQAKEQVEAFFAQEAQEAKEKYAYRAQDKTTKDDKLTGKEKAELKKLWRKLAHKYHPDLAQTDLEKKANEVIMKKINQAYTEGDWKSLQAINQESGLTNQTPANLTSLQKRMEEIVIAMANINKEYRQLLRSEWNLWKIKLNQAKLENRDLFKELEEKLKQQIKEKEDYLAKLND